MKKLFSLVFLLLFFVFCETNIAAQIRPTNRLAEVRTVFVDDESFKVSWSSCGRRIGGMFVPCEKDNREREAFLDSLKRWLVKYGFTLALEREKADAVLQGDLLIEDDLEQKRADLERLNRKKKDNEYQSTYVEPSWSVRAWLVNDYGERFWRSDVGIFPPVSYKPSGIAKIEGKKLARKLQYDHKKAK